MMYSMAVYVLTAARAVLILTLALRFRAVDATSSKTEIGSLRPHLSECGEFESLTKLRDDQGVRRLPSMLALAHAARMDNPLKEVRLAIRSSFLIVLPCISWLLWKCIAVAGTEAKCQGQAKQACRRSKLKRN